MTDEPKRKRGNPNLRNLTQHTRPASGMPAGGDGIFAGASGGGKRPFSAETQPSPDAKSAGQAAKALMVAALVEKQLAAANVLIDLMTDKGEPGQTRLNAANSLLNRLHGTPAATLALANADDVPLAVTYKWQDDR